MDTATLDLINMVTWEINKEAWYPNYFDECQKMHKLGQKLTHQTEERRDEELGQSFSTADDKTNQKRVEAHAL